MGRINEKNIQSDLHVMIVFLNTNMFKNRELTKRMHRADQKRSSLHTELGFKILRLVSMVPAWILEPCLPTAEKYDVCMYLQIHAGLGFGVPKTEEFLTEMLRLDSPYIGIVPDSDFSVETILVMSNYCREVYGTNEELTYLAMKYLQVEQILIH